MEIYPEMVQDGIKKIIERHKATSVLNDCKTWRADEEWSAVEKALDAEYDALTKELVEHAYSFAELPPPVWTQG